MQIQILKGRNVIKCQQCDSIIESIESNKLKTIQCSCGLIGITGGRNKPRRIGDHNSIIELWNFNDTDRLKIGLKNE